MSGLILLGAGSFAMEVTDVAEVAGIRVVACVINVGKWDPGDRMVELQLPIYDLRQPHLFPNEGFQEFPVIGANISPKRKELIEGMIRWGFDTTYLAHPSMSMSRRATIGTGVFAHRLSIISSYTRICDHVILNRGANVGHHVLIEPYSTIGPGAVICGNVIVREGVFIGANATILEGLTIGMGAIVGAGAVVTRSVHPGVTVKGVPARETI